jgi:hypothetical protein
MILDLGKVMVSNERVKTVKCADFNPYTFITKDSKSYLRLQVRTLEDRAVSTPPPCV